MPTFEEVRAFKGSIIRMDDWDARCCEMASRDATRRFVRWQTERGRLEYYYDDAIDVARFFSVNIEVDSSFSVRKRYVYLRKTLVRWLTEWFFPHSKRAEFARLAFDVPEQRVLNALENAANRELIDEIEAFLVQNYSRLSPLATSGKPLAERWKKWRASGFDESVLSSVRTGQLRYVKLIMQAIVPYLREKHPSLIEGDARYGFAPTRAPKKLEFGKAIDRARERLDDVFTIADWRVATRSNANKEAFDYAVANGIIEPVETNLWKEFFDGDYGTKWRFA